MFQLMDEIFILLEIFHYIMQNKIIAEISQKTTIMKIFQVWTVITKATMHIQLIMSRIIALKVCMGAEMTEKNIFRQKSVLKNMQMMISVEFQNFSLVVIFKTAVR